MSRVGKAPIAIPSKVKIDIQGQMVSVDGPKGSLSMVMDEAMSANIEDNVLTVTRTSDAKRHRALHGLTRALLNNMVVGVHEGFALTLKLIGVGYRSEMRGNTLVMYLGYSHPIVLNPPEGITITVEPKENIVKVEGVDKAMVGQCAAKIRSFRSPEPYKGKGVRYIDEHVRIKAGKTAGGA